MYVAVHAYANDVIGNALHGAAQHHLSVDGGIVQFCLHQLANLAPKVTRGTQWPIDSR